MQKKIIVANWKLNGSIKLLHNLLKPITNFVREKKILIKLIIVPPFVYLYPAYKIVMNTKIMIGAQNVDLHLNGAFTGEISVSMLNDVNVKYVIIGHSERRLHHKENNIIVAKKFKIVKDFQLIPILCIGETENDYNSGMTKQICQHQIDTIFDSLGEQAFFNTIIAYEPIWAIGSGKIPSLNFIEDICNFIKNYILKRQATNKKLFYIQYGGSVNQTNIKDLCKIVEIDGFLIGSASLDFDNFFKILNILSFEK
ncbi:MAG: triose-phosphate isomerase [Buchnera aphidicola (Floraphis choui)]